MEKRELRLKLRELRRNIPDREIKSVAVCNNLITSDVYIRSLFILAFWGKNNEINTTPLLQKILDDNKNLYLPFVSSQSIGQIKSLNDTKESEFGINVPLNATDTSINERLQLIIIPGLGFTTNGDRIGHGVGWYDKFLTGIPSSCVRVGLCYDELIMDSLPIEEHDQKMDIIFTPTRKIVVKKENESIN